MGFFRINTEYLTEKRVKWYFWLDFIIGIVALGFASVMFWSAADAMTMA